MRRPLTSLTPLLIASALQAATTTRADALFAGEVPAIELRIPDAGIKKLAQDPRAFVGPSAGSPSSS